MSRRIKVKLEKNGFDAFFRRVEANAKALDRDEDFPDEIVVWVEQDVETVLLRTR